ncbi:hypothetical protein ACVIHH_000019 [Bradyrhizobium sp. USDA 4518]
MVGTDSERDKDRSQTASSVTISLRPYGFETGNTRSGFWSSYRDIAHHAHPQPGIAGQGLSPAEFEERIRESFPYELSNRFRKFLESYHSRSIAGRLSDRQVDAIRGMEMHVADISYGSIEIKTVIDNLDQIISAFGLSVDIVTAILMATSPEALNAVLGIPGMEWSVAISAMSIPGTAPQPSPSSNNPSRTPASTSSTESPGPLSRFTSPTFVWKLLNALWVLPILVSLLVLTLAYREMNRITELHDADRSKVLAEEIARVAARSDHFDQQQTILLQRYETLSRENTEVLKVLIQRSGGCCKSYDCDCKNGNDRGQKPADSK